MCTQVGVTCGSGEQTGRGSRSDWTCFSLSVSARVVTPGFLSGFFFFLVFFSNTFSQGKGLVGNQKLVTNSVAFKFCSCFIFRCCCEWKAWNRVICLSNIPPSQITDFDYVSSAQWTVESWLKKYIHIHKLNSSEIVEWRAAGSCWPSNLHFFEGFCLSLYLCWWCIPQRLLSFFFKHSIVAFFCSPLFEIVKTRILDTATLSGE